MHLADEGLGPLAHHSRGPAAATVADLAGTDAEMVVVVCHAATIGARNAPGNS